MAATPTAREWDSQSLHADSATAAAAAAAVGATLSGPGMFLPPGGVVVGVGGGGGGNPGATIEYLRDLVQKRIITLTYTRNVHDGCVFATVTLHPTDTCLNLRDPRRTHWFHTIMMTRAELDRAFNNTLMKKRYVHPTLIFLPRWAKRANSQPRPTVRSLAYRTHRFAILAMSLSSLFDISQPSDFLRSALNMLTEYEQAKEDNDRPKIVWLPSLIFFPGL